MMLPVPAPTMSDRLQRYREMRDFDRTAEPTGGASPEPSAAPRFVVQEHHATALHWDFRLEREGVLVSWAIPRGIPPDPKTNHLAVHTEDHPLSYISFEGEIPEGSYGAGRVILWDEGTYDLHKWRDDEVIVTLHGRRLDGRYALFQTSGKDWMIHRMDPPQDPAREPMPESVQPMLARLAVGPPAAEASYAFEVKWDGVRAVLFCQGGRVRVQTRNLLDATKQYPELAALGQSLGAREVVLDGEIVAFNDRGVPSFERLQERLGLTRPAEVRRRMQQVPVVYVVFDILYLDGRSTTALPYRERRLLLDGLGLDGPNWQTPAYQTGDGAALLRATRDTGLEGLVAKRLDSPYEPGRRSGAWLKIKNEQRQEFVVGGWTPGAGTRGDSLGALLLGYYDLTRADAAAAGRDQRLHLAGKVGSGFSNRTLATLLPQLRKLERTSSPFAVGQPEPGSRFVEPRLVADVCFTEWTRAGTLRHPSFEGLRPDKDPRDVILETPTGDSDPRTAAVVGRPGPGSRGSRTAPLPPSSAKRRANSAHASTARVDVVVDGRTLSLSNLDKVLYPATGFTKGEAISYYTRVSTALLPHLRGRPMTLKRYPEGVEAPFFYEKECPSHAPSWVRTAPVPRGRGEPDINYCLVDDLPTLVWLANLAALELHPLLASAEQVTRPASVVFDLDPGPPADVIQCAEVAVLLHDLFSSLGLQVFAKTSGSKGIQVYLPLNTSVTYAQTKPFAQAVARVFEREHPQLVTSNMSKALRPGKVLVDWSQNDEHKSTVAVYSLRARERPTVSTPVTWEEVRAARDVRDPALLTFQTDAVLARVEAQGDLFASLLTLRQELPGF
ncbi:MAG: DNA ligase D [Dehalococcoidia bacterium]|nr:DNA ligase D [Dehalococcoidia bacterium]